jgi:dienelactone hydrolase
MPQLNPFDSKPSFSANPILTFSPVVLSVPGRQVDLQIKISMPAVGNNLPIILFSHGHGRSNFLSSLHGYGPLVDFYAAQGFVVIQPTHQSSKTLNLDPSGPEGALFWRSRATDMHFILDHLDQIEATVPGLSGRLDRSRIAAVGHSMGGHTVGMLAGMRVTDPHDGKEVDLSEPRIKAGVLIGAPGKGADAAAFVSEHYPVLCHNSFAEMTMPALVVAGDKDKNIHFSERDDWRADAYHLSPGPKCLLTIFGGEHILGGISGYDAAETTDDSPERVALVQKLTLAYLRSVLYPEDASWENVKKSLKEEAMPKAKIDTK